jgi:hypothetical protein
MTREEWRDVKNIPSYEFYKGMGWPEGHNYDRNAEYRYITSHLVWIKTAIHADKHVPDEILRKYPELLQDETIRILKPKAYEQVLRAVGKSAAIAKEPWEMTYPEYEAEHKRLYESLKNRGYIETSFRRYTSDAPYEIQQMAMSKKLGGSLKESHYIALLRALQEGKDVPDKVVKEYPELTKKTAKPKRRTMVEQHLDRVIWFGGFPMRRGDVMAYMGEVAKSQDPKNWLRLRDAGLLGNYQYNEKHGYPPEGTEPISLSDFRKIVDKEDSVSLQTIEDSRSIRSKEFDERQSNATTIESDDPRVERWERDPGSMDIQGIDTPKKHKPTARKPKTRKTQKHNNPGTELRGMR